MEYIKLKNIVNVSSGQNAPQAKEDYVANGYNFIKVSNLDDIIADDNENRTCKITDEAIKNNKLKLVEPQSILFAKSGLSCIKNRVYLTKNISYVVNHLCILSNINDSFDPKWLSYFIKFYDVTKLIKDESYPSISLKDIKNIDVPVLSKQKQINVVSILEKIESAIKTKKNELLYFDELIKSRFISQETILCY